MKRLQIIAVCFLALGCANVSHHRTVTEAKDGTKKTDEKESARFFLEKEAAEKISVITKDSGTNYSHSVSATGLQISGDVELVKALGDAIAKALAATPKP